MLQVGAVDDGHERQRPEAALGEQGGLRRDERRDRRRPQLRRPGVGSEAEMAHEVAAHRGRLPGTGEMAGRAALEHDLVEEAVRRGHAEQRRDAHRAGRLTEDRHPGGIAAERRDVVADPSQCQHLVEQPGHARAVDLVEVQEAEGAEPVVERDDHDVAPRRQVRPVVPGDRAGAREERAAVDPDQHGQVGARVRCPDVQGQAVLALRRRARAAQGVEDRRGLRSLRAVRRRVTDAAPAAMRLRRGEASVPDGGTA